METLLLLNGQVLPWSAMQCRVQLVTESADPGRQSQNVAVVVH